MPPVTLRYVDGLQGSGTPITNDVIEEETRFTPELFPLEIEMVRLTGAAFVRGDTNSNRLVELVDAIRIFGYLFRGNPASLSCLDAADANDTEEIDLSDGIYILRYLFFIGGPPMPAPFPNCGFDRGVGALNCDSADSCS